MDPIAPNLGAFEQMVSHWIRIIGTGIDLFGVLIIVAGIAWSSVSFMKRSMGEQHHDAYKVRIGRSLLLGLEVLVAADIVKTIALEPTFMSLGVLMGLVLVRTFLGWTLVLEIEGRWPWQAETLPVRLHAHLPTAPTRARAPRRSDAQI